MNEVSSFDVSEYDAIRAGCQSSADVLVPLLLDRLPPLRHVVDVGCGEGWFGRKFSDLGVADVTGIDGHRSAYSSIDLVEWDLETPLPLIEGGRADAVLCLEVAEHLSPERGESFVADLCALAPIVVFSAAIPGQGGIRHINCRWLSYWADVFSWTGFRPLPDIRQEIWDDARVEPWYRQNLAIFSETATGDTRLLDLVHPRIWEWYRL